MVKWGELFEQEEPVLIGRKDVWERADGIAILPRGFHVVIDIDEFDSEEQRKTVAEYLAQQAYAVVLTKRGIHVHFNSKRVVGELRIYDNEGRKIGEGGGARFKHLWAAPPTNRHGFVYQFFNSTDTVPELISVSIDEFESDIGIVFSVKIEELKQTPVTGTSAKLKEVDPVPGITELTRDEVIALLAGIYHAIGCSGLRDLVLEWLTTGKVNMRKFSWANRTSRFQFIHIVAATLALLGATEQQVAEVLNAYEDLDGKPHDAHKSALWTVYKWKAPLQKRIYILPRGQCPFCVMRGYRNCGKNPAMRVYWWLQSRGRELAEELVQHLLTKRAKD